MSDSVSQGAALDVCVYTSCSINYLPKARVLAESLKRANPSSAIVLCLNDVIPQWLDLSSEPFDRVLTPRDLGYDNAWVFKHNVMELCTAVKGRALVHVMEQFNARLYAYLDPDVYVYRDMLPVLDSMGKSEIGLVPHICKPESTKAGLLLTELSVLAHGTYNLGHLFVRKGPVAAAFAQWWADRLDEYCYDSKEYGIFTDQRWCDLVPAIFDNVAILKSGDLDVASWNVHGCDISIMDEASDQYMIGGIPLVTYHFSGTGPTGTHARVRQLLAPTSAAVASIEKRYEDRIAAKGQAELEHYSYGGDYFSNGEKVTSAARLLYRRHASLSAHFPEPFEVGGESSYYAWLAQNHPGAVQSVTIPVSMVERAYLELFDEAYYLEQYPDVKAAIDSGKFKDARHHYETVGSRMSYDPNIFFSTLYYVDRIMSLESSKVSRVGVEGRDGTYLWHYLTVGIGAGIEPIEHFRSGEYLNKNPDVAAAVKSRQISSALAHYLHFGDRENRPGLVGIDVKHCLKVFPEVASRMPQGKRGIYGTYVSLGFVAGRIPALGATG